MRSSDFKHVYAMFLLVITLFWGAFAVFITYKAIQLTTPVSILGAAGVDALLGSLIAWNSLIIQFYFRKASPEDLTKPIVPTS